MRVHPVLISSLLLGCNSHSAASRDESSALIVAEWSSAALRIRGTVSDSAGQAMPGLRIAFMECAPNPPPCNDYLIASVLADSAGRFSFIVPKEGDFAALILGEKVLFAEYMTFRMPEDSAKILRLRVPVDFRPHP